MIKHIEIRKQKKIVELQEQFNKYYPFLRIEFFFERHVSGKGTHINKIITNDKRLGQVQLINGEGVIKLSKTMTVEKLEKLLEDDFGLFAQVFRKSGEIWLETSVTDSWTLEQQNEEGKNLSEHFRTEKENAEDHDIY